jgi:NAD+ diphosphatase
MPRPALSYHGIDARAPANLVAREQIELMHTPREFTPSHARSDALPANALAFAFRDDRILVGGLEESPSVPDLAGLERLGLTANGHYLGELAGVACVAVPLAADAPEPAGWRYAGLRSLFFRLPESLLAIAARAFQVVEWDRTHRYCGRCGTPTRDKTGERAKECPACGYVAYPRVTPAMMVLVTRGTEVLLARSPRFPAGMYSALAGFVEPGETIEDCIHREVREEVGLEIDGIRYFASQSWAFPHSLMIAYTAEYAGGELRLEPTEIAEAKWFPWDAVPRLPPSISISRRLIEATVARLGSESRRPC